MVRIILSAYLLFWAGGGDDEMASGMNKMCDEKGGVRD